MASTSSAQASSPANNAPPTDRNSNPNSVGNNPNLNSLLSRGTSERHSRQHASPHPNMREYCLRWNNHQPNLVTFFTSLLGKESFVDVTLVSSEGRKIQAHKLVLSACSPYFQHVFENNPCKHPIVILKDVQYADLRTIISFIYNGEVNIAQDRMNSILATAGALQVKGLAEVPADELKRVGGSKTLDHSNNSRHHHKPSSPWNSGESDGLPLGSAELPRKRLKRGNLGSMTQNTNGDLSTTGSFESGVGASVSRSIDDGIQVQGADGGGKSPSVPRTAPPPLTVLTPKSQSLDAGLDKERREAGGSADSELSSGGFSENQNFDDSSTGAERGYDLEVADVKMEDVENDEGGELEFDEEDSYDNPEYGDPSYLNMPASSSASYFQPPGLHFGPSQGSSKGRRGRPLLRQPRIKRQEETTGGESESTIATASKNVESESETEDGAAALAAAAAAYKEKRFGILRRDLDEKSPVARQQSIVPIVTVSGSSPTPPSSPPPLSIDESEISASTPCGSFDSAQLLSIPNLEQRSITTGTVLVKQISQPLLPSHTSVLSLNTQPQLVQRQHSTPPQSSTTKSLAYFVSSETNDAGFGESTYLVDTSTGIIQILSPAAQESTGIGNEAAYTKIPHTGNKDMEVFKAESISKTGGESMEDPNLSGETTNLSFSIEEDGNEVRTVRSGHCPVLRPGPALGCNYCWNSVDQCGRVLRRKTKYQCPECHINLCIVPCFQEYHERTDKKRPKGKLPKPSSM